MTKKVPSQSVVTILSLAIVQKKKKVAMYQSGYTKKKKKKTGSTIFDL